MAERFGLHRLVSCFWKSILERLRAGVVPNATCSDFNDMIE